MGKLFDLGPIQSQLDDLEEWLMENAPEVFEEQKHLDEGTPERAYWHYGRAVALRDAIKHSTED